MGRRVLDFADGFTSASAPTTGSLWDSTTSTASPQLLSDGLTAIAVGGYAYEVIFVKGTASPVTMTIDPQIDAGTDVGQMIRLVGTDVTDTITMPDGLGTRMNGGIELTQGSVIDLMWDGTVWNEVCRNDI